MICDIQAGDYVYVVTGLLLLLSIFYNIARGEISDWISISFSKIGIDDDQSMFWIMMIFKIILCVELLNVACGWGLPTIYPYGQ